jgi:hypothetical protein
MDHPLFNTGAHYLRRGDVSVANPQLETRQSSDAETQEHQSHEQKAAFIAPSNVNNLQQNSTPWPVWAILAQITALGCLAACGIVLAVSNHKPQSSWHVRPSVVLGILAPVGAFCLSYVHKEAAAISWWLKYSTGGTTADLHREWAVGQSFWNAASQLSLKSSSTILATSTLSLGVYIAVNPLLQRASNVELGITTMPVMVNTSLPVNLPLDWNTTAKEVLATHAGAVSSQLLDVIQDYNAGTPIATNVTGCDGTCTGTIQAFGLNGTCQESSASAHDWAKSYFEDGITDRATLFNISFPDIALDTFDPEAIPQFQFSITYWTPQSATYNPPPNSSLSQGQYQYCPGVITTKNCTYFVDQVDYPVSMTNSSIVLTSNDSYFGPPQSKGVHLAKLFTYPDKLSGFQLAARNLFSSSVQISNPLITSSGLNQTLMWAKWDLNTVGALASEHAQFNFSDSGSCFQTYTDPTDQITRGLSDILLRSAVAAAKTQNETRGYTPLYQQKISAQQTKTELVFASHYGYFAVAAAIMLIEMVLLCLPFWGCWRLNRAVTLSPVETALALEDQVAVHGRQ